MEGYKSFLISLDYGNRKDEKKFVGDVLDDFDKDSLTGAVLFINNNIYSLELYFFLNFEKNSDKFENWLNNNYPEKTRVYNLHVNEFYEAMQRKAYNTTSLLDSKMLDFQMPSTSNEIFLFPDREIMNKKFGKRQEIENFTVFLSHSSKEKHLVDKVFNELQKSEVKVWFDRYEIRPGDSITEKLNAGLKKSKLGLLFLSKNFLNSKSGWTMSEANYFFQKRIRDKETKFVVVNIDLAHDEIPPLLQDYKFINWKSDGALFDIISAVNSVKNDL